MPSQTQRPTSPSAVKRFTDCERRFWFQDVMGMRGKEEPSPALSVGNAVHAALARGFRLRPSERGADNFEEALRAVWRSHCKPGVFGGEIDEKEWGEKAIAMIRDYADRTDLDINVVGLEASLTAPLPGDWTIGGRIDRVDRNPDGTLAIRDYKTGKRRIEEEDLRRDPAAQIYLLLADTKLGLVDEVRFIYLATGEEISWRPEREDLPHIAEAVTAELDGIWQRRNYEANPGRQCSWCPFASICHDGWAALDEAA